MSNTTILKNRKMRKIKDDVCGLKKSPLYKYRVKNQLLPVIGEGSHDANIVFIGEAPGKNEAVTGRPFCGTAGKILNELIESIGIQREDVYITNIVKDRPPFNRDPTIEEIKIYGPFLDRQINTIQPNVIATLGRFSMKYIMEKFNLVDMLEPISKARGKKFTAQASYGAIIIIPFFHPAVAIYNPHTKDDLKKDFKILKKML